MSGITARYPRAALGGRIYRRLRLALGGLRALADRFPERGLVADLGCGMGLLAHLLLEGHPDRSVLAVDHDPERIALLAQSAAGRRIETLCADFARVALPPCAGVALVDVLHYLDAPQQEALLERAARALESGGVLLLRDPDAGAGLRFRLARWHEAVAVGSGWTKARQGRYRPATAWSALLEAFGLEARVLPLSRLSPYADRVVIGTKP